MQAEARFGPLGWGVLGALCCAAVSGFEPNLLEEGIELHVPQRLAQGEQLYRDVLVLTGLASAAAFALARAPGGALCVASPRCATPRRRSSWTRCGGPVSS